MPYHIEYLDPERGVITEYWGELTETEFLQCTQEKFSDLDALGSYRYSISDFTQVTKFSVGMEAIKENAMLSKYTIKVNKHGVMAVVVSSNLLYGLGNIWRVVSGESNNRVRIFISRGAAANWVAEQLKILNRDQP